MGPWSLNFYCSLELSQAKEADKVELLKCLQFKSWATAHSIHPLNKRQRSHSIPEAKGSRSPAWTLLCYPALSELYLSHQVWAVSLCEPWHRSTYLFYEWAKSKTANNQQSHGLKMLYSEILIALVDWCFFKDVLVPHLFFLTEHNLHFTKPSMAHIWKNHPHSENALPLKSKVFVLVNMTHPLHVSSVISVCLCHCSHMCSWPPASFLCLTMKCSDTAGCWDYSKPLSAFCCLAHRCTNGRNCKFLVNCNKFNTFALQTPKGIKTCPLEIQNDLYFSEDTVWV